MEREQRLDAIRAHSERFTKFAQLYARLRWMAERETATNAFLELAEAAGALSNDALRQTGNMLDILQRAGIKTEGDLP